MLDKEIKRQYKKMRGSKESEIIEDIPKQTPTSTLFYNPLLRKGEAWEQWEWEFLRRNIKRDIKLLAIHLFRSERMIVEKIRQIKKHDKKLRDKKLPKP